MGKRFDTREDMDRVICDFLDGGGSSAGIDVSLSRLGAVDLDLLVECLNEMKHRMSAEALEGLRADRAFVETAPQEPIKIVA